MQHNTAQHNTELHNIRNTEQLSGAAPDISARLFRSSYSRFTLLQAVRSATYLTCDGGWLLELSCCTKSVELSTQKHCSRTNACALSAVGNLVWKQPVGGHASHELHRPLLQVSSWKPHTASTIIYAKHGTRHSTAKYHRHSQPTCFYAEVPPLRIEAAQAR